MLDMLDVILEVGEEVKGPIKRMQRSVSGLYCASCVLGCTQCAG